MGGGQSGLKRNHKGWAAGVCRRGVPGQPLNAWRPMATNCGGSVISAKAVQPRKARCSILVRAGGSVTSAKDVQPRKACCLIVVRAGGSVTSAKAVQP